MTAPKYKIISLRAQSNGFKQRDVTSAGLFTSYEDACAEAERRNEKGAIYTTYQAIRTYQSDDSE